MKFSRVFLFIFVLPLTLLLDFILYGIIQSCPACGSFTNFLKTEGALSFPFVIEITEWTQKQVKNSAVGKRIIK